MTAERTQKQNFLDLSKGIPSDTLLQFGYGPNPYSKRPALNMFYGPGLLNSHRGPQGGVDIWGVSYVSNKETGYQVMPEPNHFILDDITKWRDVIKAPDLSNVDWEEMVINDRAFLASMGIDQGETALAFNLHGGYFIALMSFMGFTEGLCAIAEEPEEVKALMEYLCDFYMDVAERSIDYYKPDMVELVDDVAAWAAPFISLKQYRELIKPFVAREAKFAQEKGLPIIMHCCGKCEALLDDFLDMGVQYWEPAQTCNDLVGIKNKYGKDLIVIGGFDMMEGNLALEDCSEEVFKQAVKDTIDTLSVGGNYVFDGWIFADPDNEALNNKNKWLTEVVEDYGDKRYRSIN